MKGYSTVSFYLNDGHWVEIELRILNSAKEGGTLGSEAYIFILTLSGRTIPVILWQTKTSELLWKLYKGSI